MAALPWDFSLPSSSSSEKEPSWQDPSHPMLFSGFAGSSPAQKGSERDRESGETLVVSACLFGAMEAKPLGYNVKQTFSCLELSKFLHVTQGELLRPTVQPSMVTNPCASPWALVAGDAVFCLL